MRCHICKGFTNDNCIVCGNYTCSLCIDEGICKRCKIDYTYIFPQLSNILNLILFIVGILSILIGFILVATALSSDGIHIFPFVFIELADPIILPIIILFVALPIILMLIFMRQIM
jgi:hypothetical protein